MRLQIPAALCWSLEYMPFFFVHRRLVCNNCSKWNCYYCYYDQCQLNNVLFFVGVHTTDFGWHDCLGLIRRYRLFKVFIWFVWRSIKWARVCGFQRCVLAFFAYCCHASLFFIVSLSLCLSLAPTAQPIRCGQSKSAWLCLYLRRWTSAKHNEEN